MFQNWKCIYWTPASISNNVKWKWGWTYQNYKTLSINWVPIYIIYLTNFWQTEEHTSYSWTTRKHPHYFLVCLLLTVCFQIFSGHHQHHQTFLLPSSPPSKNWENAHLLIQLSKENKYFLWFWASVQRKMVETNITTYIHRELREE